MLQGDDIAFEPSGNLSARKAAARLGVSCRTFLKWASVYKSTLL